jgi:hypothetical protein
MSTLYRVTLVQLKADATALAPATDKLELGQITGEEVFRLAGNLLKLNFSAQPKAEPGIIVQRGEKGWRIAVHGGRLCMHKSTSLFDEYWTVDGPQGLAQLPPFKAGTAASVAPFPAKHASRGKSGAPQRPSVLRTVVEVAGLFGVGVVLIMVGLWYGLPHRKLSDLPPDVIVVTADSEKASVFSAVAGSYITGKKPGDSFVTITADGRVSRGRIGKDGKPAAPDNEEQALAARKGNLAAIVTKLGVIAEFPPDAVNVGPYRWRKLMTN